MERFIFFVCLGSICSHYISSWLVLIAIAIASSILINSLFPDKGEITITRERKRDYEPDQVIKDGINHTRNSIKNIMKK